MPLYDYYCCWCAKVFEERNPVGTESTTSPCCDHYASRLFTPTTNIAIPEHFRHLQSQFLPQAGDTAAWAARGKDSQYHVGPKDDGREFEEFVQRDLARQGVTL